MLTPVSPLIRKECPPGACVCERERLFERAGSDMRILMLTQEEEKKLIARIDAITSYPELCRMQGRMQELLGIVLTIAPSANEVRTVRGFAIELRDQPGLCRKTRQTIPAAVRRCLENHPEIAYTILDEHDLLASTRQA
jgi:hypothetical protein